MMVRIFPKHAGQLPLHAEIKPALSIDQALAESSRCLFCHDAPCMQACPTHIDVPLFIRQISTGNPSGAARTIFAQNVLGHSCARVCPTEELCEGACVLSDQARPIDIGSLQRFATDHALSRQQPILVASSGRRPGEPPPDATFTVGIVGAGPAGLACAAELLRLGYRSVIYEQASQPGGLNTTGVAQYKMVPRVSLEEVEALSRAGLELRTGVAIGRDISVDELLVRHRTVFLGVGMGRIPAIGLAGEDHPAVWDALELIARLKQGDARTLSLIRGAAVAVIGGGNTSIDVVTQAVRASARKVWLVYRRSASEMPAYPHEVQLALQHGVEILCHATPTRVVASSEGLSGLEISVSSEGSSSPQTKLLACDLVVRATGQRGASLVDSLPVRSVKGVLQVDAHGRTSHPRLYAGGDCVSGGQEVVNAVEAGKKAARAMLADHLPSSANSPTLPGPAPSNRP